MPNFRACKNAKFALQHPIIFGFLASPWTTLREHLISSQFFSKRNAFQIGFTPSLPPLSERLIAHFLTIIDVVLPQDIVYPRRNCSERVSRPSPQEKLQLTTSSPLLPRFLHCPSLSTHRLFCAWPPPEADRDCRQRAGGPCPTLPLPRSALRRLDRLAYGRSPRPVDLPLYPCLSSDRAGRFALAPNFEINFPFFVENVRFAIFHPKLALPPSPRFEMRYV